MSQDDTCGCCKPAAPSTPEHVDNRPGLSSIRYRIGTYASFKESMIENIASLKLDLDDTSIPILRSWTSRSSDDYGIALLEMWAYLADILTFYQERIANEAYLRTARLPESVRRLAALLDYRPTPGVAAEAFLAFTAEKDKTVKIPVGLKVQSVPGQDEKPQKFETIEAIVADSMLNMLRIFPRPQAFNPLYQNSPEGTMVSGPDGLKEKDKIVIFNRSLAEVKEIVKINDRDGQRVLVWNPPVQQAGFELHSSKVAAYRRQFKSFGYNSPDSYLEPTQADVQDPTDSTKKCKGITWETRYNDFCIDISPGSGLNLDARYDDLKKGTELLIVNSESSRHPFARMAKVISVSQQPASIGMMSDTVTRVSLDLGDLEVTSIPVAVLDKFGLVKVFCISSDGELLFRSFAVDTDIKKCRSWTSLGGRIDRLAVVKNKDGLLEIFARGMGKDKALWHISQKNPGARGSGWSPWATLGGQIDLLAVVRNKDDRIEVFASGKDKALWHIAQTSSGGWSQWASLGGRIDMLAVGKNKDGLLEVFARGMDKALHYRMQTPSGGWSSWASLDGQIDLLAVVKNKDDQLEVFVRGKDLDLLHSMQAPDSSWGPWKSLGGQIDLLAVGKNKDGLLEVFARGKDLDLLHLVQAPDNSWGKWESLGSKIDKLAVERDSIDRLMVFARGKDKALWRIMQNNPNAINGDWTEWQKIGNPVWLVGDLRKLMIFELVMPEIQLWDMAYPGSISGDAVYLPAVQSLSLEPGRTLILDDKAKDPQTVEVLSTSLEDIDGQGKQDYQSIRFMPQIKRSLDEESAVMYGNIARATHGEAVAGEVLGDGDASKDFQSFVLSKYPVTFVHRPDLPHGSASTLHVFVDDLEWHEVRSFYGRKDKDRVFKTEIDKDSRMIVQFGDGINGAHPTSGSGNITAKYRQGLGRDGNVGAETLKTLLDKPLGLKSVINPDAASGGADTEPLEMARKNAPNTVRTFDRIVSLMDFEDAAREFAGIAKARSSIIWDGESQAVNLVVACDEDDDLTDPVKADLISYLDARRDKNLRVIVEDRIKQPLAIKASIDVDPDHIKEKVKTSVFEALKSYFSFDNRDLGSPVHISDVYRVIHGVDGVISAHISELHLKDVNNDAAKGMRSKAQVQSQGVPGAVYNDLFAYPDELIAVEDPINDIIVDPGA